MSIDYESIYTAASQLSIEERLRLIDDLAASVPDDHPPTLSEEWVAEIEKRDAEMAAGTVTTIPWNQVRDDLFRRVGIHRED